ncbi:MAG: hypothetical protein IKY53_08335 [Lachnospiraceae bacterium]|nr:hypothetical protein [Lachnospiraceae bacterium]
MKQKKVIYYKDVHNDEFSDAVIEPIRIDENYKYIRDGFVGKFLHIFWYKIIAIPLAWLWLKLWFGHRIIWENTEKPKNGSPFFLYGNHTHFMADALIPTMVSLPHEAYVVVHPNNVSMAVLGKITPYLGALPLPDTPAAAKEFSKAVNYRVAEGRCLAIYPEAHIWPYYTDIRPFKELSFRYPVKAKCATYCFTNTYQKRKLRKTPRIVTYVDGPFYPKAGEDAKLSLRNQVYAKMKERAANNTVSMIEYIYRPEE